MKRKIFEIERKKDLDEVNFLVLIDRIAWYEGGIISEPAIILITKLTGSFTITTVTI